MLVAREYSLLVRCADSRAHPTLCPFCRQNAFRTHRILRQRHHHADDEASSRGLCSPRTHHQKKDFANNPAPIDCVSIKPLFQLGSALTLPVFFLSPAIRATACPRCRLLCCGLCWCRVLRRTSREWSRSCVSLSFFLWFCRPPLVSAPMLNSLFMSVTAVLGPCKREMIFTLAVCVCT